MKYFGKTPKNEKNCFFFLTLRWPVCLGDNDITIKEIKNVLGGVGKGN